MARIPVATLKDVHKGEDIYVVAAGPSAEYVDPAFFNNKISVGVNRVWVRFATDYLVIKERNVLQAAIDSGAQVVASKHHCGSLQFDENDAEGSFYVFDHAHNDINDPDLSVIGTDRIVVGYSTLISAMHVAAYMGAQNLILVGHDCGKLDGKLNFEGYPRPLNDQPGFYEGFLGKIEAQTKVVRDELEAVYGCRTYSLNPFVNFGLENHVYERLEAK